MTDAERQSVIEIASKMIGRQNRRIALEEKRKRLRSSAELATAFYQTDRELTILTELDREDFIDAKG